MDNLSQIVSGSFVATGGNVAIRIPTTFSRVRVYNWTAAGTAAPGTDLAVESIWATQMGTGGIAYIKASGGNTLEADTYSLTEGIKIVDTSIRANALSPAVAVTSITNATPPVVATGNTQGMVTGDLSVVRLINIVGGQQLGGIDFSVGTVVNNTSFTLAWMQNIVAATTGFYRIVRYPSAFVPPYYFATNISNAVEAIVTLSVTHALTVGQQVRMRIPAAFGMVELNELQATIVAIGEADVDGFTNTVTINVDTSGFSAFVFPTTANALTTPALLVPFGEVADATIVNPNTLNDSVQNQLGVFLFLYGGEINPAGSAGDIIYWEGLQSVADLQGVDGF